MSYRMLCVVACLGMACDAEPSRAESEPTQIPDPFSDAKFDDASSLQIAWDPPRPLAIGASLEDQEVGFSLTYQDAEVVERDESVDEDGTINIDIVVQSQGQLVLEVGRYFVDLDAPAAGLTLEVSPQEPGYEPRWLIGRPGQQGLTSYTGDVVTLDDAQPGQYRVAVMAGTSPSLDGTFRYSIAADTL